MLYGDEKPRQMARSILPSASREASRKAKRGVKRGARRVARHAMTLLLRDPGAFDEGAEWDDYPEHALRQLVQQRRGADKVNPFIHWAEKVTVSLPPGSRLSQVRALLPEGVIGEHALSHLKYRAAFQLPQERELRDAARRAWRTRPEPLLDRGEMAALLRELLTLPGLHRAFNRWLQRGHVTHHRLRATRRVDPQTGREVRVEVREPEGATAARKLLGAHDVLPFLDVLDEARPGLRFSWNRCGPAAHPEWLVAADLFLRAFKVHRGDLEALGRALEARTPEVRERAYPSGA